MDQADAVIAVVADRDGAEAAVRKLSGSGFDMKQISVVGQGCHSEDKVVGFYNAGQRIRLWGMRGAFWGHGESSTPGLRG
jgi:Heat induced stress protein YflT domain